MTSPRLKVVGGGGAGRVRCDVSGCDDGIGGGDQSIVEESCWASALSVLGAGVGAGLAVGAHVDDDGSGGRGSCGDQDGERD